MLNLGLDRPRPVDYEDSNHGVPFFIGFKWGRGDVPEAVVLLYQDEQGVTRVADVLKGIWKSFDEAVQQGKAAADAFVEHYWQD